VAVLKYDVNGHKLWETNSDGGFGEQCQVAGAALDSANNFYVEANFPDFPYVTLTYSNNGAVLWFHQNPTYDGFSFAYSVALDKSNEVLITGRNSYDYPQAQYGTYKLSTEGGVVLTNLYPADPTAVSSATAIAIDRANKVYVTGFSPGTNSGDDIVTIKYDNNGNQIWVQRYNGPGNGDDEASAIAVDALGNVYVTGYDTTAAGGTEMVLIKYAPSPTGSIQPNGSFLLQVQGEPGEPFDIQATTNFQIWLDIGTTNADTNGNLQFLDTNAPLFKQRFYITKPQ
jgi:hypothetical protein